MSVFRTKGVILRIHPLRDKEVLYDIFTYEYGKIPVSHKLKSKEKTLDLGYVINFEVYTKEGRNIHKMRNIKILGEFDYLGKPYQLIEDYLELLQTAYRVLPDGVPVQEAFEIFELINHKKNISNFKLLLGKLKLLEIAGILGESKHDSTKKILHFIRNNRWKEIIKLSGEDEQIIKELQKLLEF